MEAGATLTPPEPAPQAGATLTPPEPAPQAGVTEAGMRPVAGNLEPATAPAARGAYVCPACGHQLRGFGGGRHRIYFPSGSTRLDDPVMDGRCPGCGTGLPGKQ